ncbi:hypothetical protein HEP87_28960 [Streptomyces sp. S1D4-11]
MEAARRAPHRPVQLAYDYSLFAPADATAPKVCRDFVRAVLLTLDRAPLVLPAILCTSELVTNVHLHTKGTTMLRVQLSPARVRVSVYDESHDPRVRRRRLPPPAGAAASRWSPRSRTCGAWPPTGRDGSRRGCGSSCEGRGSPADRSVLTASGDPEPVPLVGPVAVPTVIALLVPHGRQAHT